MADTDKQISALPAATSVDDASLFVMEQQGDAMSVSGALIKSFAVNSVAPQVQEAQEAAEDVQRRYLENLMEKGVQIIENNVKILENGYQYEICAEASGIQQIGFSRPVQPESGERAR